MIKLFSLLLMLALFSACHHSQPTDSLALLQIQDRNGLTETISNQARLSQYEHVDFNTAQPYKKVQRIYKGGGKNCSKLTTYHPNGNVWQYLEAQEMRAHGAFKEWFANGQIKIEATVIGGTADLSPSSQEDWLFDNVSKVWDERGNLLALMPYQKGMLEGTSLYYYPTGTLEREIPFVKNEIEGELIEYFPDGSIKLKVQYKRGYKEGESVAFFKDGRRSSVEDYSEGFLRTGTYYNYQGEVIAQIQNGAGFQAQYIENGLTLIEFHVGKPEGLVRKFSSHGELIRTYSIKNGKKEGDEIEYYLSKENPQPKLLVTWHDNAIHGTMKTWYDNHQLQSQREYSRNQRSGPSLAWYKNGSFMMLEEYEEDRLLSGQYYKMNKQEPISSIINGNGLATLYDETGALLAKVTYLKGKPVE